jgi:hypothetical protein
VRPTYSKSLSSNPSGALVVANPPVLWLVSI